MVSEFQSGTRKTQCSFCLWPLAFGKETGACLFMGIFLVRTDACTKCIFCTSCCLLIDCCLGSSGMLSVSGLFSSSDVDFNVQSHFYLCYAQILIVYFIQDV